MLGDITKLTTRFCHGRGEQRWACGLEAHMGACRGVGIQEPEIPLVGGEYQGNNY